MASNPLINRGSKSGALLAIIAAAATGIYTFTGDFEGTKYKAYKDPIGKWTICKGHTKDVFMGQVATEKDCLKFYEQDMQEAMFQAIAVTPTLVKNTNALKAAGDFTFNAGIGSYKRSPMAAYFAKEDWVNGCNAFVNYYNNGSYLSRQPGMKCKFSEAKNKWLCELPGLTRRRLGEKKICLGLEEPTPDLK